jgi:hypothetical protein
MLWWAGQIGKNEEARVFLSLHLYPFLSILPPALHLKTFLSPPPPPSISLPPFLRLLSLLNLYLLPPSLPPVT